MIITIFNIQFQSFSIALVCTKIGFKDSNQILVIYVQLYSYTKLLLLNNNNGLYRPGEPRSENQKKDKYLNRQAETIQTTALLR